MEGCSPTPARAPGCHPNAAAPYKVFQFAAQPRMWSPAILQRSRAGVAAGAIGLDDIVDLLGIAALLDRRPHTKSGGERQRVAIGQTLLAQPPAAYGRAAGQPGRRPQGRNPTISDAAEDVTEAAGAIRDARAGRDRPACGFAGADRGGPRRGVRVGIGPCLARGPATGAARRWRGCAAVPRRPARFRPRVDPAGGGGVPRSGFRCWISWTRCAVSAFRPARSSWQGEPWSIGRTTSFRARSAGSFRMPCDIRSWSRSACRTGRCWRRSAGYRLSGGADAGRRLRADKIHLVEVLAD